MDEPAILPPQPVVVKDERRRSIFISSQSRRSGEFREREWERERERDIELMPPPSSHKKNTLAPMDVDQSDPNEPTYCICHQVCFIIIFLKRGLFYNIYQFFKFINYSFL